MSLFTKEMIEPNDDEAGIHMCDIGRAVMIWSSMNYGGDRTVAAAAKAFNTTPQVIQQAVEADYWSFIIGPDDDPSKQIIDVDGE